MQPNAKNIPDDGGDVPEGYRRITVTKYGVPSTALQPIPNKKGVTNKSKKPKQLGRPKGSKNLKTLAKEEMVSEFHGLVGKKLKNVVDVLLAKALDGDLQATKLILDRVVPVQKASDGKGDKSIPQIIIEIGELKSPEVKVIEDAEFTEIKE